MRNPSFALENFTISIAVSETLLDLERTYEEPLKSEDFKVVQGLRGGALVLMVASFENYLREAMEERLNELSASGLKFASLPIDIRLYNHRKTLEQSLKPFVKLETDDQRILGYIEASEFVVYNRINPEAFSTTIRSNPSSKKVSEFFNSIGHKHFFNRVEKKFEEKTGNKIDVKRKLDSILSQRHQVAHSGINSITLSRYELGTHLTFFKTLSELCDVELFRGVKALNKSIPQTSRDATPS